MWDLTKSSDTAFLNAIDVVFTFKDGYTRPVSLRWENQDYTLGGVQFWYSEHKHGTLVHHYKLSDRGGSYTFELALETENLTWRLERATPVEVSGRISPWSAGRLVGTLS